MKIIAIGHQKEVGKDEFVKYCIDHIRSKGRKLNVQRRGFADPLYDICYQLYGWAGFKTRQHYVDFPKNKATMLSHGKTVRETLIEIGQHLRKYDNDIWVNAALKGMTCDVMFMSDLRFPHEFLHCQANGGFMVKVTRPGLPEPTDEADTALNGWDSRWDITIRNSACLNALYKQAVWFVDNHILTF